MSGLEVDIEDKVVAWAKKHKFLTPKVKFVEAGYPDRLFISPYGHTIFIEFKKPGEEPTPIQAHRLTELTKRGVPATWCDNVIEAIRILEASLETAVGAPSVSEEGNTASIKSGVSGALSGSRPGEDLNCPSRIQDPEGKEAQQKDADHSPPETSPQGMARRDQEVVRLLRPDAYNPTWGREGHKPSEKR